jgi:hypothetical protein
LDRVEAAGGASPDVWHDPASRDDAPVRLPQGGGARGLARWHAGRAAPPVAAAASGHAPAQQVALLLHKLAGTAAMFGEAALGDSAAALERALAMEQNAETCVALALELLLLADRPSDAELRKVNRAAG